MENKIKKFMLEFQELWYNIENIINNNPNIISGEVVCEFIDESDENPEDYFGYNFTKKNKVYNLFFSCSNITFPAIYVGEYDKDYINKNLDKLPIYIFDLENDYNTELYYYPNFYYYIKTLLDYFTKNNKNLDNTKLLNLAYKKLNTFFTKQKNTQPTKLTLKQFDNNC